MVPSIKLAVKLKRSFLLSATYCKINTFFSDKFCTSILLLDNCGTARSPLCQLQGNGQFQRINSTARTSLKVTQLFRERIKIFEYGALN
ncbi:CRISPR system single-strand-specific deoxyribonuclease Cas10/Csm1 (subtype III-A) [Frankliniella fusca]|uniref:CRISPR system single-strand-specific deoxyribonuclease Cas10/Csm1 (Subtype III-A) n=1 Tax=Frankliniella fusca TaxID=407009 RepID=A0AAE1LEQ4_9NEOP|nr:CRISPR system single-strand-specific deoxyribonuclease Cas10/Csm1 (subtype III-A) [Frankliniella fusca]